MHCLIYMDTQTFSNQALLKIVLLTLSLLQCAYSFSPAMTLLAFLSLSLVLLCFSTKNTTLTQAQCLPDQRRALIQLKQDFNTTKLHSWNASTDCCIWDGITCDEKTGMVTALNLFHMHISGEINPVLFNLSSLRYLNLSDNRFSYIPLPQIGFERLANLTHLDLSDSGFAGQVPISISALTNLISLDLSNYFYNPNQLYLHDTGLKTLLSNLTKLQVLRLDGVDISLNGSEWGNAVYQIGPTLQELSMRFCGLIGNLPDEIFHLTNLTKLDLSENLLLSGQVPIGISALTNLISLDLSYSGFTGQVPISISALTNLISLDLSTYTFNTHPLYLHDTGLKTLLRNLTKLQVLHLDGVDISLNGSEWGKAVIQVGPALQELSMVDCGLRGNFPDEIFHLTNLTELDLSDNSMLSGQLSEFMKQSLLHSLYLGNTNLTGPLPDSIGNLQYLSYLDLSYCNFYGEVPPSITNLTRLEQLDLKSNRLTGTIPMSLFSHPSLISLFLSNNQLSGYLPEFSNGSSILAEIYLDYNNLQGQLPISIFKSPQLYSLDLASNNFSGTLNLDVIKNNKKLQFLALSDNKLSIIEAKNHNESFYASFPQIIDLRLASCNLTYFPTFLSYQTQIGNLDLSDNIIDGVIPNWLCTITTIRFLDLSHNFFTKIEKETHFTSLSSLLVLDIHFNRISGPVPLLPPKIQYVDYSSNYFFSLPTYFSSNSNTLEILDLGNNQIVNRFPFWLGNLKNLRVLILRSNQFYGTISNMEATRKTNISLFPTIRVFDLSSNRFRGIIPKIVFDNLKVVVTNSDSRTPNYWNSYYYQNSITTIWKGQEMEIRKSLTIFSSLDLSQNGFSGEIPQEIGQLKSLDVLNLSHNALTGPIPSEFANLQQLQSLDLSSNQLSGQIPQELTSLTFLSTLNLSYNNLVGEIPQARQFSTFSNASYLGNPGLCGSPLSMQCAATPSNHGFSKGLPSKSSTDIIGLSVSIGVGLGVGFASVIWTMISWENGREWFNFIVDRFYYRHIPWIVLHLRLAIGRE